jgi:ring-1,2-phenylacetyl-CoA epoxidase subunit PaaC
MSAVPDPVAECALRLGDDALISAQRLAEWSARAPEMEEDIALSNIALDQLGAARLLLSLVGDEDELAFLRDDHQFRNCLLAELPNAGPAAAPGAPGDFGVTMVKLLMLGTYQLLSYEWLAVSSNETLRDIAAKARKESRYHVDHAAQWTVGSATVRTSPHRRMQAAVDDIWPYTHELFEDDPLSQSLEEAGVAPLPSSLKPQWTEMVTDVLTQATLSVPADGWRPSGGRAGRHTEHLSYLVAEMQVLHRAHPGAKW